MARFCLYFHLLRIVSRSSLIILACACLAPFFTGCGEGSSNKVRATNGKFRSSAEPVPDTMYRDLKTVWKVKATDKDELWKVLHSRVANLPVYVHSCMLDDSFSPPGMSEEVAVSAVDRNNFASAYLGDRIQIGRWRPSSTTSSFSGKGAFLKSIHENFSPWVGAEDIEVSIQVFKVNIERSKITAQLLVEVFGRPVKTSGRSATSIWDTQWSVDDNQENIVLTNVAILGQEEIVNNAESGTLYTDCTGSIMRDNSAYNEQLAFGLDDWARRIPGLDIGGDHGIAVGDINRDDLDDIYFCQPHGLPNLLFVQNDDGSVREIGNSLNVSVLEDSRGALFVDLDNDQDQDLVVGTNEALLLFSQARDGKFQLEHRIDIGRDSGSISAADFDQDGDLDLFLCKYDSIKEYADVLPRPKSLSYARTGGRNVLLRNDEGWKFTDVTDQVGLAKDNNRYTRGAIWLDYDLDGDQDLYVTNEFNRDNLYENQDGLFTDVTEKMNMVHRAKHRTCSAADFNQDGNPDIFVGSDVPSTAHQKVPQLAKEFAGQVPIQGLAETLLAESLIWFSTPKQDLVSTRFPGPVFTCQSTNSSVAADVNNDGLEDLIVTNGLFSRTNTENIEPLFYQNVFSKSSEDSHGHVSRPVLLRNTMRQISKLCRDDYSYCGRQRNRCFLNIGTRGFGFANFSPISGLDLDQDSKSVATTDWDHDGDVDVVVTSREGPQLRIFVNGSKTKNDFVQFSLTGTTSNRDAIGTRVEVYLQGRQIPLVKSLTAGSGTLSQSSKKLLFGLGIDAAIEKVVTVWPDGDEQTFGSLAVNNEYRLVEDDEQAAQVTYDRSQLVAIEPQPATQSSVLPPLTRAVFYPPFDLPFLEFQGSPGQFFEMEALDERPLVALFWSDNAPSTALLRQFASSAEHFADNEVNVVAVYVSRDSTSTGELWHTAEGVINQTQFPFRWGTAAPSTNSVIEAMLGDWFCTRQLDVTPFALLIDPKQRIRSMYSGAGFLVANLIEDFAICTQSLNEVRDQAAARKGEWITRYPTPKNGRLISDFKLLGFSRAADHLNSKSTSQAAIELVDQALVRSSQGDWKQAQTYFEKAIKVNPNYLPAYLGHARLLIDVCRNQKQLSEKPGLLKLALQSCDTVIDRDPKNTEAILGRAEIAAATGNTDDALKQLKAYLEVDSQRYEVHALIGRLHYVRAYTSQYSSERIQEELGEAKRYLMTALANRPSLPSVAGDLGFIYLQNRQYDQSLEYLRMGHRLQPGEFTIQRNLAVAEFHNKKFDRAVELTRPVVAQSPEDILPKKILAWLYATSPNESYRDGAEGIKMAEALVDVTENSSPMMFEVLAACYAETRDFDNAILFQDKALELANQKKSNDPYTSAQLKGLKHRLSLYERKLPYRTSDLSQDPFGR